MGAKVSCVTPEAALSAALLYAISRPETVRLYDAAFGMYSAEGEGWWWRLQFLEEAGSNERSTAETLEQRVPRLIGQWAKDVCKYKTSGSDTGDQG